MSYTKQVAEAVRNAFMDVIYDNEDRSCAYRIDLDAVIASVELPEPETVLVRVADEYGYHCEAEWYSEEMEGLKLYAEPVPSEPINQQLLDALKLARKFVYILAPNGASLHKIDEAIAAAEAQGGKGK